MSLFKYRIANIALFCTTNIQNYFHVSKCAYVYFYIKEVFFFQENWAQFRLAFASKSLLVPLFYYFYYFVILYSMVI